jgi:hypothetical protein
VPCYTEEYDKPVVGCGVWANLSVILSKVSSSNREYILFLAGVVYLMA